MQPSETCNEKKDQTSFIVHKGALASTTTTNSTNRSRASRSGRGCNVSKTILLLHKPEEKVDIQFSLSYSTQGYDYNYGSQNHNYLEYNFILTFQNNLHDVSYDYAYEIDFFQYVHDEGTSSHTLLFSQKQIRTTNKVSITKTSNYSANQLYCPDFFENLRIDTNERHMCCTIRRYNTKTTQDVDLQSVQNITLNIGAMLFEKGLYSDVTLLVGEESFKVHKDILSSASDIFKAMFSHDMTENKKGEVIIEDFEPQIVKGLLLFIYTGETPLLPIMPIELFQAAHKYEINSLKTLCIEYCHFIVNNENVVSMLDTANMYELTDFKTKLWKFIDIHEEAMVKEESFQEFLCRDLKIDTAVYTLKLCDKYEECLNYVETETFQFIKKHNNVLVSKKEFLELFASHSSLMTRLYVFIHANE